MCPTRSSSGSTSSAKRSSNSVSCRATISASPPPSIRIDEPGLGDLLARTCAVQHALDQNLQLAAGRLLPEQTCGDDTGIVEHHQIAQAHMLEQIGECDARPMGDEQSGNRGVRR